MRRILFLLIAFSICAHAFARTPTLISATLQEWSGGIAGRHGKNYNFNIAFAVHSTAEPDSIWIDGKRFKISNDPLLHGAKWTTLTQKSRIIWQIALQLAYNNDVHLNIKDTNEKPPIPYNGVALIRYYEGGKSFYFKVTKLTARMPPVNYP